MFNTRTLSSALALLGLIATSAHAQIATFTYSGDEKGTDGAARINHTANQFDAGLAAAPALSVSPSSSNNFAAGDIGVYSGRSSYVFANFNGTTDLAGAKAANSFLTFTVAPSAGNVVNLSSFSSLLYGQNSTPYSFYLLSSLDNFDAPIASTTFTSTDFLVFGTLTADLSGAAYQNLSAPIEFRIYAAGGGYSSRGLVSTSTSSTVLDGTVTAAPAAAPEPSQFAAFAVGLLGLGLLSVKARRRALQPAA